MEDNDYDLAKRLWALVLKPCDDFEKLDLCRQANIDIMDYPSLGVDGTLTMPHRRGVISPEIQKLTNMEWERKDYWAMKFCVEQSIEGREKGRAEKELAICSNLGAKIGERTLDLHHRIQCIAGLDRATMPVTMSDSDDATSVESESELATPFKKHRLA